MKKEIIRELAIETEVKPVFLWGPETEWQGGIPNILFFSCFGISHSAGEVFLLGEIEHFPKAVSQ